MRKIEASGDDSRAVLAHVVPFCAWLALMIALGDAAGWKYAARTGVAAALLCWARPWRWYAPLQRGHVVPALIAGALVFAVWILPECSPWRTTYLRWAVLPFGRLPEYPDPSPYAPAVCGWPLTLVRLLGSGLVIAVIEEFFWRGFLYRWLLRGRFLAAELGQFLPGPFLIMCLLFGFEHDRWLAGMVAGAVYGGLMIRTRNLWSAVIAHATTNLLLGGYVLSTSRYQFW